MTRWAAVVGLFVSIVLGASTSDAQGPPSVFDTVATGPIPLDRITQIDIQKALLWTGQYDGTIQAGNEEATNAAIMRWQRVGGFAPTGNLTADQVHALAREGLERRRYWQWTAYTSSNDSFSIGFPKRLLGDPQRTSATETVFQGVQPGYKLTVESLPRVSQAEFKQGFREVAQSSDDRVVDFSVQGEDWWIVSGTKGNEARYFVALRSGAQAAVMSIRLPRERRDDQRFLIAAIANSFRIGPQTLTNHRTAILPQQGRQTPQLPNGSIDKKNEQRAEDVKLAGRIRNVGWFGRIDVYPVAWNKQFAHYIEFAQFSFTSKGLVMEVRDDLSDKRKAELKAAGVGSYSTPLHWKDDLCWQTKQLQVGKEELPYQPFASAVVPNDERTIAEIITSGCVDNGQIRMQRDWTVESRVKGSTCGPLPRGPRGGCMVSSGEAEDRDEVTFAVGSKPARTASPPSAGPALQAQQPSTTSQSISQGDALRICGCIGRAEAANDFGYRARAESALRNSGQLTGPWVSVCEEQRDKGRLDGVRSRSASIQWQNGYGPSCEDLLR